jgi:hypothetical protein
VTFVVQEVLERSLHTGTFVWQAVESPTFVPGLVLQLPFAALAFLVARLVLRTASTLARWIETRRAMRWHGRPCLGSWPPRAPEVPRLAPLAALAAGRAPPLLQTPN